MAASPRDTQGQVSSGNTIQQSAMPTHQAGDVLVWYVWGYNAVSGTPSGWTQIGTQYNTPDSFGGTINHRWYYKVAASGSESVPSLTNGATDSWGSVIVAMQGADTTSPVDAGPASATIVHPNALNAPSVSPTGTDSYLLAGVANHPSGGGGTFTPPSGMTELFDGQSWDYMSVAGLALSSSGATGTKTFTKSGTSGQAHVWQLAIKSAAAGGTPATIVAPAGAAIADAAAAVLIAGALLLAPAGAATADGPTGTISAGATVIAPAGTATADAAAPTIQTGTSSPVTITAPAGAATADAVAPVVLTDTVIPVTVVAVPGLATADALPPDLSIGNVLTAPVGQATADAVAPTVATGDSIPVTVAAPAGTAVADAGTHTVQTDTSIPVAVTAPAGTATAGAAGPSLSVGVALTAPAGEAIADAEPPAITGPAAPTPASRIIAIAAESRVITVPSESRTITC